MDTVRWIMQVEVCSNHPNFGRLVQYLYENDKVLSLEKMDPINVFKRAGGADVIRSVLDISSYPYNAKDPRLVNSFKTTTLLRELTRCGASII